MTGPKRRDRVRPTRQQTRERVLDGAAAAFAERGFHGAAVDDICIRAGLTRGAFHSSFGSKEDLFFALYDRMLERVRTRLVEALRPTAETAAGSLEAALEAFSRNYPVDRDWHLLSTEYYLYAMRQPSAAPRLAEHRTLLRQIIVKAMDDFLARQGLQLTADKDKYSRLLLAIHEGNFSQSLVEPRAVAPGELLATFAPGLLSGVTGPRSTVND